jgi:hypothetical protein
MKTENNLHSIMGWVQGKTRDALVGSLLTLLALASIYGIIHGSKGLHDHHFQPVSLEGLSSLGGGGLGAVGTAILTGLYLRSRKHLQEDDDEGGQWLRLPEQETNALEATKKTTDPNPQKAPAFVREPTPEENQNLENINKFFERLPNNHFVSTNMPEFGMCVAYKDMGGECFLTFHPTQQSLDKRELELSNKSVQQLVLVKKAKT